MKRSRTYSTSLTHLIELDVTVEGTISPGCRGARGEYGVPLEPDEPPCAEDIRVYLDMSKGARVDITDLVSDADLDALADDLHEFGQGAYDDRDY